MAMARKSFRGGRCVACSGIHHRSMINVTVSVVQLAHLSLLCLSQLSTFGKLAVNCHGLIHSNLHAFQGLERFGLRSGRGLGRGLIGAAACKRGKRPRQESNRQ